MLAYFKSFTIEEGFSFLNFVKPELEDGTYVSKPSGFKLFEYYHQNNRRIACFKCRIEASHFIACQHKKNLKQPPIADLYAFNGKYFILMTRDHIIPKSLNGSDHLDNLRPACENCNKKRGNKMTAAEEQFMKENPHLLR